MFVKFSEAKIVDVIKLEDLDGNDQKSKVVKTSDKKDKTEKAEK